MLTNDKHIILFDGVCNLCNGFVQFVIKHDKKNKFKFSSLQSPFSQNILLQNNIPNTHFDSFIYWRHNKILQQSTAALYVLKDLKGWLSIVFVLIIIPRFLRNAVYNFIAKNRYKWFGKTETCWLPTPQLKAKFIEN